MSGAAKCKHCEKTEGEHTDNPADYSNCGDFEPSPAPQTQPFDGIVYFEEWVALGKPDRSYANWLEFQLTAARAERDIRHTAIQQPLMDKIQEMSKELTALREERDRAQAALRELDRYVRLGRGAIELGITEDGNIGIWLANEEKTLCKGDTVADAIAALKPVSDRQPEGETK